MSKKMHRCPHCGGKGYGLSSTTYHRFEGSIDGLDYDKPIYLKQPFMRCKICGEQCGAYCNGDKNKLYDIISTFLVIVLILAWVFVDFFGWLTSIIITGLIATIDFVVDAGYFSCFFRCLLPITDDGYHKMLLKTSPNCRVRLNDSKYIRKMWVYGLKFSTETKNVKFKERFADGLVPAQFYPAKDGSNEFEIRIIGKEFVPDEVLFEGAEFLVEDIDGIFICKGKITKLDLEF